MSIFRIVTLVLLVALIGLTLYNNKKEIDQRTALADLDVAEWPVETKVASLREGDEQLSFSSVINPKKSLKVIPLAQGQVSRINVKKGDFVRKGAVLGRLNDDLIIAERSAIEASLAQSRANVLRMENLSKGQAITAQQLEQAQLKLKADQAKHESLTKRLDHTIIRAPFSATVKDVYVEEGGVIGPGSPFCELVDNSLLQITLLLSESQLNDIEVDMPVRVTADLYPGKSFDAKVTSIAVGADRSFKFPVEVQFKNDPEYELRAGMFATATLSISNGKHIWIERNCILGDLQKPYVYVVSDGKAVQKEVVLGRFAGNLAEIIDGLSESHKYVYSGQRNLENGVTVRVIKEHK